MTQATLRKQFKNFKSSYMTYAGQCHHDEYKRCLSDEYSEEDEMIHFLLFHRWWDDRKLLELFPDHRVTIIEKAPYSCSPSNNQTAVEFRRRRRLKPLWSSPQAF